MTEPTEIDYAQLAAYIDGEGCIAVYEYLHDRKFPRWIDYLRIVNTDPRLILWLKNTFGGKTWAQEQEEPNRTKFSWNVGNKLAEKLIRKCLPYFKIKVEQAELFLAYRETLGKQVRKGQPRGTSLSSEMISTRREIAGGLKSLKKTVYSSDIKNPEAPVLTLVERKIA